MTFAIERMPPRMTRPTRRAKRMPKIRPDAFAEAGLGQAQVLAFPGEEPAHDAERDDEEDGGDDAGDEEGAD
ncbi:hypothetical protein, partial [Burkholderia multivorans]|uniref:hypothetical protein n=1 Tax=Burkholderia multivorans TaxID=87883 RepID=UPI0021AC8AE9